MLGAALLRELFKLGEHDNRRELQLLVLSGYLVSLERPVFLVEVFRRYRRFILCDLKPEKICFVFVITHLYLLDPAPCRPRNSPIRPKRLALVTEGGPCISNHLVEDAL